MMLNKLGESRISEVWYRVEWAALHPGRRFRLIAYITTETVIDVAEGV